MRMPGSGIFLICHDILDKKWEVSQRCLLLEEPDYWVVVIQVLLFSGPKVHTR